MVQTELRLKTRKSTEAENPLVKLLILNKGWVPAAQLERVKGWKERKCRAMAEESNGRVISGQRGYKATECATPKEIRQATNWLWSQARKMSDRAVSIQRVAHNLLKNRMIDNRRMSIQPKH